MPERTYKRWKKQSDTEDGYVDRRTTCERPVPANKLSELEERQVLNIAHSEKYALMPPSQIVPSLADKEIYIASNPRFNSFYI
jgi:putative transposase